MYRVRKHPEGKIYKYCTLGSIYIQMNTRTYRKSEEADYVRGCGTFFFYRPDVNRKGETEARPKLFASSLRPTSPQFFNNFVPELGSWWGRGEGGHILDE